MKWWVTRGGQSPIGPVSTELLLEGIAEGMVPHDSLVCELGGTTWRPIGRVPPFSEVLQETLAAREDAAAHAFDDPNEKTIADAPPVPLEDPTDSNDPQETTIVDLAPLRPSTPPPKR